MDTINKSILLSFAFALLTALLYDFLKSKFLIRAAQVAWRALRRIDLKINSRADFRHRSMLRIRELMEPESEVLSETFTIDESVRLLLEMKKWRLPVEDAFRNFKGLVFLDVLRKAQRDGRGRLKIVVEMKPCDELVVFHAIDPCADVLRRMSEARVSTAPVTLNGRVVGFVTAERLMDYLGVEISEIGSD